MKNEEIQSIYNNVSVLLSNKANIKLSYTEDSRFTDSMTKGSWKQLKFMMRKINCSNVIEPQLCRHKTVGRNQI